MMKRIIFDHYKSGKTHRDAQTASLIV